MVNPLTPTVTVGGRGRTGAGVKEREQSGLGGEWEEGLRDLGLKYRI